MDTTPQTELPNELEDVDPAEAADIADRLADELEAELDAGATPDGDPS